MFLKSKWRNLSIKKKIFLWSSLIIIISFTLLYICMYFFMPRVYEVYKVNNINEKIRELKSQLEKDENIDINELLDEFSYKNNLDILLVSKDENNLINKIIYSSFREGANEPNKIPFLYSHVQYERFKSFQKYSNDINLGGSIATDKFVYGLISKNESLNIDEIVYVKSLNNAYHMIVHFPVSPENEASDSIALFLPFAIFAIVIIAFTISSFYSILISRPLIKINKVAKKMANLDFDNIIEVNGEDEIGELSNSLNLMNKNLKESFEELERMNSKLTEEIEIERKLEKERREFVATISHELKSPITIISGQLEGMLYNIGKYKDRDKYLKESYEVTQKMSELVQEILHLSERENGEFKYNFSNVNLSNVIKSILRELRYFIDEKKLNLITKIDEDIFIIADEKLIKKVIMNIIKNAIEHSRHKGTVKINITDNDVYTAVYITNRGEKLSDKQQKQIFERYYSEAKYEDNSMGIGLPLAKAVIEKQGGYISVESDDEETVFIVKYIK